MVEQHPFLQWRQCIDILDVRRPAWHSTHNPLDGILAQVRERQHRRCNSCAPDHDSVGGHLYLMTVTQYLGKRRKGWLGKQQPHIRRQSRLTHPAHQTDGQ